MRYNSAPRPRTNTTTPERLQEAYNFGLLKTRKNKIQQSESIIKNTTTQNFANMNNERLLRIINTGSAADKRALSRWFFEKNGIYSRAVRYIADILKYDYLLYPNLDLDADFKESESEKILKKFNEVLGHFDASSIQLMCRKWAGLVCLDGVYYGYICDDINDKIVVQDLPVEYCRSRFLHRGLPLVEFNALYFDKITSNAADREKILSLFPEEFQKGYREYKAGKLPAEAQGDKAGWFLLDPQRAFKFSFFGDFGHEGPPFLNAIPDLLELDEVKDINKEKLIQQIQKILVQEFELDAKGQIPFTMKELQQLNENAVEMVGDAVGVSVLSTVAKVHVDDLEGNTARNSEEQVDETADSVYDAFGISSNIFNTSGSTALEKSIAVDEAFTKVLMLQFEAFFNNYLEWKFNKNNLKFRFKMLNTSIFNYKDLAKEYENLTKIGFSRFLPVVALGHTQKEVTSMAKLEQQIMQLDAYMLPPFSSNTMSSDTWGDIKAQQQQIFQGGKTNPAAVANPNAAKAAQSIGAPSNSGGRPALEPDKKSDKTLANEAAKG